MARAGGFFGSTHASHTAFISSNVPMSASQMLADKSFDFSLPAAARRCSIAFRMAAVCQRTLAAGSYATWPAR